jgi:hypothetical protein
MPYCPRCGTEALSSAAFCTNCGTALTTVDAPRGGGAGGTPSGDAVEMNVLLSPARIVLMSVLSYGSYLLYWFYLTWKHYRTYTGRDAYPVWHALTLFIPIYGLFRTHAHVRSFKELMAGAAVATTLNTALAVWLMIISTVLDWNSIRLTFSGEITQGTAVVPAVLDLLSIGLVVGLLLHVQGNLNRYWTSLTDRRVINARLGVGEVIFGLLGILAWLGTISTLAGWYQTGSPI